MLSHRGVAPFGRIRRIRRSGLVGESISGWLWGFKGSCQAQCVCFCWSADQFVVLHYCFSTLYHLLSATMVMDWIWSCKQTPSSMLSLIRVAVVSEIGQSPILQRWESWGFPKNGNFLCPTANILSLSPVKNFTPVSQTQGKDQRKNKDKIDRGGMSIKVIAIQFRTRQRACICLCCSYQPK